MTTSNLFEVKWETQKNVICNRLGLLRKKKLLSDVILSCEGETFYAHRIILALSSGYFLKLLTNVVKPEVGVTILICGIKKKILHAMLCFIYDGIAVIEKDEIPELLKAGSILEIPGLLEMGENYPIMKTEENSIITVSESENTATTASGPSTFIEPPNDNVGSCSDISTSTGERGQRDANRDESEDDDSSSKERPPKFRKLLRSDSYNCSEPTCFTKCSSKEELVTHMKTHNAAEFQCRNCDTYFDNSQYYFLHTAKCDKLELEKNDSNTKNSIPTSEKKSEILNATEQSTPEQSSKSVSPVSLKSYKKTLGSENTLNVTNLETSVATLSHKVCSYCNKVFSTIVKYKKHRATDCKMVQCHYCLKEFSQNKIDKYETHLTKHEHEPNPYSCPRCSFRCANLVELENHFSIHTGIYRFWCPLCDYQINHIKEFEMHTKEHCEFNVGSNVTN